MMQSGGSPEGGQQEVVVDRHGRHSLWPQGRALPAGWTRAGFSGSRAACLDHIGQVWRDQQPRTLTEAGYDQR